ncbi:MAG: methylated-DNA--[protein]-cysteine S-methyltransferase, partial [Thermoplasmata archaeon]
TPHGCLQMFESGEGLYEILLDGDPFAPNDSSKLLDETKGLLRDYFNGADVDFSGIEIDFSDYTEFQKRVLKAVMNIPLGEVRSYKQVAEIIGRPKAYRPVGNALGKNRTPIVIPCHRVVRSDGSLGGYRGGVRWKRILLGLEGVLD